MTFSNTCPEGAIELTPPLAAHTFHIHRPGTHFYIRDWTHISDDDRGWECATADFNKFKFTFDMPIVDQYTRKYACGYIMEAYAEAHPEALI